MRFPTARPIRFGRAIVPQHKTKNGDARERCAAVFLQDHRREGRRSYREKLLVRRGTDCGFHRGAVDIGACQAKVVQAVIGQGIQFIAGANKGAVLFKAAADCAEECQSACDKRGFLCG